MTRDVEPKPGRPVVEVNLPIDNVELIERELMALSLIEQRIKEGIGHRTELYSHLLSDAVDSHLGPIAQILSGTELGRFIRVSPRVSLTGQESELRTGVESAHLAIVAREGFALTQQAVEGEKPGLKVTVTSLPQKNDLQHNL